MLSKTLTAGFHKPSAERTTVCSLRADPGVITRIVGGLSSGFHRGLNGSSFKGLSRLFKGDGVLQIVSNGAEMSNGLILLLDVFEDVFDFGDVSGGLFVVSKGSDCLFFFLENISKA